MRDTAVAKLRNLLTNGYVLYIAVITANGRDVVVNFPQQANWTGTLSEMEKVSSVHSGTM
jgi:hypothetical protein